MFSIRDLSIKSKLIMMQVIVSVIVLGLCFAAFVYTDITGYKERKVASTNAIAQVIGTGSASAIEFLDNASAREILSELEVQGDIVNAAVLDKKGNEFAVYTKPGTQRFPFVPTSINSKHEYVGNHLILYKPIEKDGEWLGMLCLRVELTVLDAIVKEKLEIGTVLLLLGVALAFFIAYFFQNYITKPLFRLINVMQDIKDKGQYENRASVEGRDEISKLSMVFNDMVEQIEKRDNELEMRVKERTAELEAANKELESFSYSVSHDMRAPLRAVSGFSNILSLGYSDVLDDEGKQSLRFIASESARMGQLIDDLLAFSRLGKKDVQKSRVNMTALANEVVKEVIGMEREDTKVQVKVDDLPDANCDGNLMRQVFINLISNAVKYSSQSPEPCVSIGSFKRDEKNVFYIKDNGVGFDMQYYHKLFGVFQRLHSQEEFKGTGIGLAIVQRVIARHGGTVWAEGKLGGGATFYFMLP